MRSRWHPSHTSSTVARPAAANSRQSALRSSCSCRDCRRFDRLFPDQVKSHCGWRRGEVFAYGKEKGGCRVPVRKTSVSRGIQVRKAKERQTKHKHVRRRHASKSLAESLGGDSKTGRIDSHTTPRRSPGSQHAAPRPRVRRRARAQSQRPRVALSP